MIGILILSIPVILAYFSNIERKLQAEIQKEKERIEQETQERYYLMGKFDPAQNENFILVPDVYSINLYPMYIRKETLAAFLQMEQAAKRDGVELKISSAARNFEVQKMLWDQRWAGLLPVNSKNLAKSFPNTEERFRKNLEYTALPGTSRHHWGTDIDINGANILYFDTPKGIKEYDWLLAHAREFGFCQPYKTKGVDRITGYNEEKWHWSYLPLSRIFTLEYPTLVTNEDVGGFSGDEFVPREDIVTNYVMSIRPDCI